MKVEGIAIQILSQTAYEAWFENASDEHRRWLKINDFEPDHGSSIVMPGVDGSIDLVLVCMDPNQPARTIGRVVSRVPEGVYYFCVDDENKVRIHALSLYWQLAGYSFTRYQSNHMKVDRSLVVDEVVDKSLLHAQVTSIFLVRDLINTPAHDMTPSDLCDFAEELTKIQQGQFKRYRGDALLEQNFPLVHAVGRASIHLPEIAIGEWGSEGPLIAIIGKGVTFDSGGLNIKPSRYMYPMKKDMGGAAHAIGLAHLLLQTEVPCRIKLIIPSAENAISGNAFRPSDVLTSRSGKTIEVGDTDAEGRLLLADALSYAAEDQPDLVIDFATLTGAARVAMGPDVPCYFTNDQALSDQVFLNSVEHEDQVWELPLIESYRSFLDSSIADIHSTGNEPYGGAIITALFLQTFVDSMPWLHMDLNAVNSRNRDGQPKGGEAQGMLAIYDLILRWMS
ncbi:leucyl aminopeptidase family protein [Gammaproteobacteria bacterium]|nr:leucyl aminopeptidase family protein [Gammaproteobacteria bacterium]